MGESIRVNFNELPLEPLEPGLLRKLLAVAYEIGATPVFVHDKLTVEVTGSGFVVIAAGEVREEEMLGPKLILGKEVVRKVTCACSDWDVGMGQIEAQQVFCSLQSAGPQYDSPMFKYCPWCGAQLSECEKSEEVAGG